MSAVLVKTAQIIPLRQEFKTEAYYNAVPEISQRDQCVSALKSGVPHTTLSGLSGQVSGRGLGFFNAVDLHRMIIDPAFTAICEARDPEIKALLAEYVPSAEDVKHAMRFGNSMPAAVEKIGYDKLPETYVSILGYDHCEREARELMLRSFGR